MSIDRPDSHTLTIACDACPEIIEVVSDEDVDDPPNFLLAWSAAKNDGWISQKPVGYDWEHYCARCAKLAEKDRVPRAKV